VRPLEGIVVVVIDGDALSAKLAALLLRDAGASVNVGFDAEQALRLVDTFRPRVVVLDLQLPTVSGLVIARHISQLGWAQATRIVAISTGNGQQTRLDALAWGCSAYVQKPLDENLVTTVVHLLKGTP
jgi:CheY-like chemotaxis protein